MCSSTRKKEKSLSCFLRQLCSMVNQHLPRAGADENANTQLAPVHLSSIKQKHALVVCKGTRWIAEAQKIGVPLEHVADDDIEAALVSRGVSGAPAIRAKHYAQLHKQADIVRDLQSVGFNVAVVEAMHLPLAYTEPVDVVVSAGGDGTFLAAASVVNDSTLTVGVNTDPQGSEGHLCVGGKNPPASIGKLIVDPTVKRTLRNRIEVALTGLEYSLPVLALNEVFMGESDAARVSYYELSIDGSDFVKQKSSGLIACTGSGSTAWYASVNRVQEETVGRVLEQLQKLGIVPSSDTVAATALAAKVTEELNDELVEQPDCPYMLFAVREAIFNHTFAASPVHGRARTIVIRSLLSDGIIVLDGHRTLQFPYGHTLTLTLHSKFALNTIL